MIIIELQGGLGNQMFQYACGKALALKHQQQLLISTGFLNQNQLQTDQFTPRAYALNVFDVNTTAAEPPLVRSFENSTLYNKALKLFNQPYKKTYREIPDNTHQLNDVTLPVLIKGYWQSEKYFAGYEAQIREVFKFRPEIAVDVKHIADKISHTNSVSIHFRRGDYLTNPLAKKVLGALDTGYYIKAIEKIKSEVNDPFFYIFSDEPEWVANNFHLKDSYEIISTPSAGHDLLLMSQCRHHIIANSSFSWWGAWLNPNPDKIVIAPKNWFADEEMNNNTADLTPTEWIRI